MPDIIAGLYFMLFLDCRGPVCGGRTGEAGPPRHGQGCRHGQGINQFCH